jgi:hypothetical protein
MLVIGIEAGASGSVPYLDSRIIAGSGEPTAIGGPGNIPYTRSVSFVGEESLSRGSIENLCRGVSVCQSEVVTIRRLGDGVDPLRTCLKGFDVFASCSIPETDGLIATGRDNAVALWRPGHR